MSNDLIPVRTARGALVGHIARTAFPPMLVFNFKTLEVGSRKVMVSLDRGETGNIISVTVEKAADLHGHPQFTIS